MDYWVQWKLENKGNCEYCGTLFTSTNRVTKDHLIPKAESKEYSSQVWTWVLSCLNCNQRKSDYISKSIPWIPKNRNILIEDVRVNKLGKR